METANLSAPPAVSTPPASRPSGPSLSVRLAVRLLVVVILAISCANLLSAAVAATGLPFSDAATLVIHSVLTVILLFIAIYSFGIEPLRVRMRVLERVRDDLLKHNRSLDDQIARLNSEVAVVNGTLEVERAMHARAEAEVHRLGDELELRLRERTASLEEKNRETQDQLAEQRRAADSLRESEKRYRRLVEIAQEGIWTINAQGKTNFANRSAAETLGFTVPEMLARLPAELVVVADLPKDLQAFDLKSNFAARHLEFRMRRKDNREIWVAASLSAISGDQGEFLGALVIFSDISAKKRLELRLQEQASIPEWAQDGFILFDESGRILSWNRGAVRLYGWAPDETLGKEIFELLGDFSSPPIKDEAFNAVRQCGAWRGEWVQKLKDGRRIVVDARMNAEAATPGKARTILLVTSDITQKKRREAQVIRDQRLESAANFASGFAQEINTLLGTTLLSSQMLRSKRMEKEDQDLVAALEASAQGSAELMRQALVFARGLEGDRVPVSVGALFREMLDIIREMFPRSIQVSSEVSPGTWRLKGDPTQLHQALLKLCVHSRDAMPGGGNMRLLARNLELDDTAARRKGGLPAGPYVVVQVQDSSPVLSPMMRERMFEPFSGSLGSGQTSGLGLSLVYGIVKSHGGWIDVHGEMGIGNSIELTLPALREVVAEVAVSPSDRPTGKGELILVVEEEMALRDVTSKALVRYGYEVLAASDASQALNLLSQHTGKVRLLLTTLMSPTLDGPALARAARKVEPQVRIMGLSGLGRSLGQADKAAAMQSLGIGCVLAKPYTAEELLQAIRNELARP